MHRPILFTVFGRRSQKFRRSVRHSYNIYLEHCQPLGSGKSLPAQSDSVRPMLKLPPSTRSSVLAECTGLPPAHPAAPAAEQRRSAFEFEKPATPPGRISIRCRGPRSFACSSSLLPLTACAASSSSERFTVAWRRSERLRRARGSTTSTPAVGKGATSNGEEYIGQQTGVLEEDPSYSFHRAIRCARSAICNELEAPLRGECSNHRQWRTGSHRRAWTMPSSGATPPYETSQ